MTLLGRIISWPFVTLLRVLAWPFSLPALIRCDRWAHLWIGSTLAMSGLWLGWYGALPVIIWALGKELSDDLRSDNKADLWDALATTVGGAIPLCLIMWHKAHP